MAVVKKQQNNFTTGVLTPGAYSRVDLAKYLNALRFARNGVILVHGGIAKRPGTEFIDEIPTSGLFLPFTYSVSQAYALLFYDHAMRIYKGGAVVADPATGEAAVIATPYALADLPRLKFAQSADTMFLAQPGHPPRTLTRLDHHLWEFREIVFYPPITPPANLRAEPSGFNDPTGTYRETTVEYKVAAVNSREVESTPSAPAAAEVLSTWVSGARVELEWDAVPGAVRYEVYKDSRGYYAWIGSAESNTFTDDNISGDDSTGPKDNRDPFTPPPVPAVASVTASGFAAPFAPASVRVSSLSFDSVESAASVPVLAELGAWTPEATLTVNWTASAAPGGYRVYLREANRWYCYDAAADTTSLIINKDRAREEAAPKDTAGAYPGAVGIYQQRLVFGRSDEEPQTLWASEIGAFDSMAVARPLRADSAITATADSRQMNEIRHFIPLKDMLMLTSGAEFKMGPGANSDALTPTSIRFEPQSYWGSSDVPPVVSGNSVLMVQNSGKRVRDLYYQFSDDGYVGNDITILAEHLIDSPIADWARQADPWSTVWVCLENGKLLTLTYLREHEIWAWSEHESSGGKFRSLSSVREGAEDNLYLLVERDGRFFVEYQVRREYGDPVEDAFFLDCGLRYSGEPVTVITGLEHLAGRRVSALLDGSPAHGLAVGEDGSVVLPYPASKVAVGLPYVMAAATLNPELRSDEGDTKDLPKSIYRVSFQFRESSGLLVGPIDCRPEDMDKVKFPVADVYGAPPPLYSGELSTVIRGSFREDLGIVFRHEDPLPLTVLSVLTSISVK